jgi:hypothetical protein
MDTRERTHLRAELKKLGIVGDFLDSWQPREDLWLHKPWMTTEGAEARPAGSLIGNQPSDMDHKLRLAVRGALPWKPSRECACKGCRERDWENVTITDEGHISVIEQAEAVVEKVAAVPHACPDCDFVVKASSKKPMVSLTGHRRAKHKELVTA